MFRKGPLSLEFHTNSQSLVADCRGRMREMMLVKETGARYPIIWTLTSHHHDRNRRDRLSFRFTKAAPLATSPASFSLVLAGARSCRQYVFNSPGWALD